MQLNTLLTTHRLSVAAALVLAGAIAAISTAWGFQLIGGYAPCKLCLEQRLPYYAGIPLTALALLLSARGNTRAARIVLALAAIGFVYGGGVGAYQAGAEWDFWAGPTDCGGGTSAPREAGASLLQSLENTRIVSCTEASWRMLGLSFAGWNVVASMGLVIVAAWGILKHSRKAA
ncbi:disulfide bond formation protein B [Breoghania sp. L-A4]|uniref:disulfide bond formation protein B n=1 Tax=Breoghania sp. L-A4 TaxID=2304600 RepID=UPI000E35C0CE|nr:disulfide bond formation protein B [Breoghania sp. L-A4]AXS42103.1 disulfide bond formation protein B [Breoghania sp. L-A4]